MRTPDPHPLHSDAPIFGLVLRTPRLVLRPVWDEDIAGLVDATVSGIHPENEMPFAHPWSRQARPELFAGTAASVWRERAEQRSPEAWHISFAIREADGDGEWWRSPVIGRQDISARNFAVVKSINSGSWLTQRVQERGLGLEMRQAVLLWAFDHLGAEVATSGAYEWNTRSLGVSRRLGYRPNGVRRVMIEDRLDTEQELSLQRADLVRPDWTLEIEGMAGVREALGIDAAQVSR